MAVAPTAAARAAVGEQQPASDERCDADPGGDADPRVAPVEAAVRPTCDGRFHGLSERKVVLRLAADLWAILPASPVATGRVNGS